MFDIKKRACFGGGVIYRSDVADSLGDAVREYLKSLPKDTRADLSGADLSYADLSGANLYRADLYYANLRGADLSGANLSGADLSGANLSRAYLSRADLYYANLSGAYLSGANLYYADLYRATLHYANLSGAKISWSSHSIISEILKNNSNGEVAKLEIAGLVSIQTGWCWKEFCSLGKPQDLRDWAMQTLSEWAWSDDDDVPEQLVQWCEKNNVERKPWPGGQEKEGERQ